MTSKAVERISSVTQADMRIEMMSLGFMIRRNPKKQVRMMMVVPGVNAIERNDHFEIKNDLVIDKSNELNESVQNNEGKKMESGNKMRTFHKIAISLVTTIMLVKSQDFTKYKAINQNENTALDVKT
jgi:hypothetical protein